MCAQATAEEESPPNAHPRSIAEPPEQAPAGAAPAAATPERRRGPSAPLALAVCAAAAAALYPLIRYLRQRQQSGGGEVQRARLRKGDVYAAVLGLDEPSAALPPPPSAASLAGRTLVLSDRLDVQGLETRSGCEAWKAQSTPAACTYWCADVMVAAGMRGVATVVGEPLGLG